MQRQTIQTMCPMNCHPTLCGMKAEVENGKLLSISGDEDNPDSRGFLCMRGNAAHEIVANPQRLDAPLIRTRRGSDTWEVASWDDALDLIADKMRKVGREAVGLWQGHGNAVNDYGVGVKRGQMERFANLYGCQHWNPAMICWGLGGFGIGLTGALETSTKEDMSAHAELIVLWGANTVSQANTIKHVDAAKRRGARIVVVDVRRTEVSTLADEVILVKPGTDSALALATMHVIVAEGLWDRSFVEANTVGFDELCQHVGPYSPDWAAAETGVPSEQIAAFSRSYAQTHPAMIIIGGSSLHKGDNEWHAARAISCLPALTGNFGRPGCGIGPRHGARSHGAGFADITAADRRPPGPYVRNQMEEITEALETGDVKVLLTLGSNLLSSFPDTNRMRQALANTELVVCYDIFMNQTTREVADIILPGTIWLEEIGVKATNTHVYLSDRALQPMGDVRPLFDLYKGLAARLDLEDVYPWPDQEAAINAVLDHPATGHATVASMRASGGRSELQISHVAHPNLEFNTPSGKIEFRSDRAAAMGLPALPEPPESDDGAYPLSFAHGRTFAHFHSFYDHARALPTLAAREEAPELWLSPSDAGDRGITAGDAIRMFNERGEFVAKAKVMKRIPQGVIWMRDGWPGLNALTSSASVLPKEALTAFPFSTGQARYHANCDVEKVGA
ncbi:MAG: molybdopterin-dependent oxidoreductase [Alphaproteobacteria bacterium]|nr:molybdopterin-dependent oxidoreductase [Alphaproteobacteria bacterium]